MLIGQLGPRHGNIREVEEERIVFLFLFFDWILNNCINIPLKMKRITADYFWHLPLSLKLLGLWKVILETSKNMTLVGCLSWASICIIPTQSRDKILAVTRTTFGKVADWKSLASYRLRLHHTCKVQARNTDKNLVEIGKPISWFTDYSC